jgi:hypothetical protein
VGPRVPSNLPEAALSHSHAGYGSLLTLLAILLSSATGAAHGSEGEAASGLTSLSFGFKAGYGMAQHSGVKGRDVEYEVSSDWRYGAAAGVFLHFPVTSRFALQQEVLYVQRGSRQDIGLKILDIDTVLHVTYDMDYVEIPVLTKFAWLKWGCNAVYSTAGTAMSLKVNDRYTLSGEVSDGVQTVPLRADSDMKDDVEIFDYSFVYGLGADLHLLGIRWLVEYRFVLGWNSLAMPTYAYVPFGDEEILIDNEPVALKNQNHLLFLGITF